jgi:hypothetical protein
MLKMIEADGHLWSVNPARFADTIHVFWIRLATMIMDIL